MSMTMKEEYTAIDMATAAADGFRDGQRAAQSAPAGEREGFDAWFDQVVRPRVTYGSPDTLKDTHRPAFQAGAAWQRAQAAGVPEGWRLVPVEPTEEMLGAGYDAYGQGHFTPAIIDCYRAMLAACKGPDHG